LSGLEEAFRELVELYYTDRTGSDRADQAYAISALTVCPLFLKFSFLLREHTICRRIDFKTPLFK
jgi:hypothetical protein